jgi:lysyl-tRNA synthetase class 2
MASLEELRATRLQKLELLKKASMEPYPSKVPRTFCLKDARANFESYLKDNKEVSLAGRIMAIRGQGAILFVVLYDGKDKFQAVFKKDEIDEKLFQLFTDAIDIGDFISVTGNFFKTQRGEESILVKTWTIASKSLLPLPEKWHGITNDDERYRKRYLDILMNEELRDLFIKKSKFWDVTRTFLKDKGFLEVETPTLEITTGGAEATPFKTHHNDYDLDVYMRISVGELWQKRLMAAGFPKTFEIGRVYRNEGSSPDHLQEFTGMEFYWSFADFEEGVSMTENMIKTVVKEVFGKMEFTTRGHSFNLDINWPRLSYVETVEKMTGINVLKATEKEMIDKLKKLNVKYDGENKERLTDTLWKFCRKQISGPAWLVNHPKLVSPLSKIHPDNPELTLRAQLILAGSEMTNGFAELNDPVDQKNRFDIQEGLITKGDTEAMMPDHEFVEMLEYGMPPTFGFAYGDRLFAFLADKPLRELQMFPLMRPKGSIVNKETKVAVLVIRNDLGETWKVLNTSAHLGASLGAHLGKSLLLQDVVSTKDKVGINLNIKHAIMIKECNDSQSLINITQKAKENNLEVEEFTRQMQDTTNDKKVIAQTSLLNNKDVERLGVLIFGEKDRVEEITKDFKLFSK